MIKIQVGTITITSAEIEGAIKNYKDAGVDLLTEGQVVDIKLRVEYLNCKLKKISDTEYRILAELIRKLGGEVPDTGLPTETVYNRFIELIDIILI